VADLLADHNFSRPLVLLLRRRGHDTVTSRELGLDRSSDGHHLLQAANLGRILLSYNERDFILLQDTWFRWATAWGVQPRQSGILILPPRLNWSPARAADEIESVVSPVTEPRSSQAANGLWRWRPARGWFQEDARLSGASA
jgi:hypothetical protein